jgi:hypothetical protein
MTDPDRGTDRAGRRAKRFLSPLQKYEVFLRLVRQEVTIIEAAEQWQVDRGVIMRIRTVAKEGGCPRGRSRPCRTRGPDPSRGPGTSSSRRPGPMRPASATR